MATSQLKYACSPGCDSEIDRIPLHGSWALWRWFVLRSAGFPAALTSPLAAPRAVAAVDRLLEREHAFTRAQHETRSILEARLAALSGPARRPVYRAVDKLRRGRRVEPTPELAAYAGDALAALQRAEQAVAEARAELERCYAEDASRISEALRAVASDARFREACTWQNRHAVRTAIDRVRDAAPSRVDRRHEQLVARYLQRYAVKNDTIGFFGPVAWAELSCEPGSSRARPGPALVSRRTVYFEHWPFDALAAALSEDLDLLIELAPRRMPTIRLDGDVLHHGLGEATRLPGEFAALLAACDGTRTAAELAAHALADPARGVTDPDEIYAMLVELRDRGLVRWALEIPVTTAFPARALRRLLQPLTAPAARAAIARLDELEVAKARVTAAAGDAPAVALALDQLDATFERLTGTAATRRPGEVYAGRTLIYEDCRRDLDLRLGPTALDPLGPPLALVLQSARWYTHAVAEGFRAAFDRIYDALRAELATPAIAYPRFYDRASDLLPLERGEPGGIVGDALAELHARWAAALALGPDDRPAQVRRIERTPDQLEAGIAAAFAAPSPGWPGARCHSPDLLIAAGSFEDVKAGRATFVLGEVHTGRSTLTTPMLLKECPVVDAVLAADRADATYPRAWPILPKHLCSRPDFGPDAHRDYEVEAGLTGSTLARDRVLAAAELIVERRGRQLVVATRDGRVAIDVIAFFETYLQVATQARFRILDPARRHTPRVTIGALVVAREAWRFEPSELAFATRPRGPDQLVEARRWASAHQLPDRVFVKVPEEPKPMFVDLASPIYVEILARLARHTSRVAISEMLPALDGLWLTDARGEAYTSELRVTAVDPVPWSPP